jgi:hypothetical protein
MPTPDDVVSALRDLAKVRVLVGIPSDSTASDRTISNATIGYIQEFGSPARNIPARAHLVPGVEGSQDQWIKYMEQAAKAALEGNSGVMDQALNAAGQTAVSAVKKVITAKIPPPLQPATVAARRRHRGPKGRAARAAYRQFHAKFEAGTATMAESSATPLVDTGQYINSITYVVGRR